MLSTYNIDFGAKWQDLGDVVSKLIRCEQVSRERWNSSFSVVYALCVSRPVSRASELYSATVQLISTRVKEIRLLLDSCDDTELLPCYVKHWTVFHNGLTYLDNLYRFVNQLYVRNLRPTDAEMCYGAILPLADRHTMEIMEVGLAQWKINLIDVIKPKLSFCLMNEVANDRKSIIAAQDYIYPCLNSFLRVGELIDFDRASMDVYYEIFQTPLLEESRTFYSKWAEEHEHPSRCSEYITEALKLIIEETSRALKYYKGSVKPIKSLFQEIIVESRLDFINDYIPNIIKEEDNAGLTNCFELLSPSNLYSRLMDCFGDHVKSIVRDTIMNLTKDPKFAPTEFVERLLTLRERFLSFVDEVFGGTSTFRDHIDRSFNIAINERPAGTTAGATTTKSDTFRPAELLSRYINGLLRQARKPASESELEAKLRASIIIFKNVNDKDLFQKFYQRMLCKRLIFQSNVMLSLEELMITELKMVCGHEFTSKFQQMFKDFQLATSLNDKFVQYLNERGSPISYNWYFNILTECSWPINVSGFPEFTLPVELQSCVSHFEAYYSSSYQGRRIHWAHQYSMVDLQCLYLAKRLDLQVACVYAAVLLLFDNMHTDRLSIGAVQSGLQLSPSTSSSTSTTARSAVPTTSRTNATPSGVISSSSSSEPMLEEPVEPLEVVSTDVSHIRGLLDPLLKAGIIVLEQSGNQEVTLATEVVLNRSFTSRHHKVRIPYVSHARDAAQADVEQIERQVGDDRHFFVQAAIVRILKTRRQEKHNILIDAVLEQAKGRFHPPVALVKRCIENLIEKGYLERSPDDPKQYSYLA